MIKRHILSLNPLQVEILLETVRGFVDNKKLLHIPDVKGEAVGLPLEEEALQHILTVMGKEDVSGKEEVTVEISQEAEGVSRIQITIRNHSQSFKVNENEFDPV